MEEVLIEFRDTERKYIEHMKETLKLIKRFKKLYNYGGLMSQIPQDLSRNLESLQQVFKYYQDIFNFNTKLFELLDDESLTNPFSLALFFLQNSSEFKTKYSIYCYYHLKHTVYIIDKNVDYFNNFSHQIGTKLNFGKELQRPQGMVPRYLKIFSELSTIAKENNEIELDLMFSESRNVILSIDIIIAELSKADSIQGCNGNLRKEGYLLKSGQVYFMLDRKSNVSTKTKKEEGHLFLFEGSLILCRKERAVYESVKVFSNFNLAVRILREAKFELKNVETNEKTSILLENNQEMLFWVQKISSFLQKYNIFLQIFSSSSDQL